MKRNASRNCSSAFSDSSRDLSGVRTVRLYFFRCSGGIPLDKGRKHPFPWSRNQFVLLTPYRLLLSRRTPHVATYSRSPSRSRFVWLPLPTPIVRFAFRTATADMLMTGELWHALRTLGGAHVQRRVE